MTEPTAAPDRRTGLAAVTAGALLAGSVAAELAAPVQRPDGTVVDLTGFTLYLAAWTAGAVALAVAVRGLGGAGSRTAPLPRSGRVGRGIALTGAVLLVAFGALGLVTALVSGSPAEWSFLLFVAGLLLMVVAAAPLALGLRRTGGLGRWWTAPLVAGAGALVALGAAVDPWHDLGLFVCFAAWIALGLRLLRAGTGRRAPVISH